MKNKAFTLMEVIVVITIIGILTLVAIPVSKEVRENNNEKKYTLYVQSLETAVNTYCDLYNTKSVTYNDLKDEELIDKDLEEVLDKIYNNGFKFYKDKEITIKFDDLYCTKSECKKES